MKSTLLIFFALFYSLNLHAQFIDRKVKYESRVDYFFVDSISYTPENTIFYIHLAPLKGQMLTFSGAYTSFSWNLINSNQISEIFPLVTVKNIKEDDFLLKKELKSAEIFYVEAKKSEYTAELYYDKLPVNVSSVALIKAIKLKKENIIASNIHILSKYGKKNLEKKLEKGFVFSLDSLKKNTGKAKLNYLNTYLEHSLTKENYKAALSAIKAVFADIDSSKYPSDYAHLLLYQGNILFYQGKQSRALYSYEAGLKIYNKLGNKRQVAIIYNNIASIYESKLNFDAAIRNYQQSLTFFKAVGDKENSSQINYKIGNLYYKTDAPNMALKYYNSALSIEEQLNNIDEKMSSYNNIGVIYYTKNQFGDALRNYFKSLDLAKKTGKKQQEAVSLNNIGNVKYSEMNYKAALHFYQQSENISTQIKYLKGLAIALHNAANTYMKFKQPDSARIFYEKSLQIANDIGLKEVSYNSYRGLAELYASKNNCRKSLDLYKKYAEIRFSVSEKKLQQINILQEKYLAANNNSEKLFMQRIKELKHENLTVSHRLNRMINQMKAERLISKLTQEKQKQRLEIANGRQKIQELELVENKKNLRIKQIQLVSLAIVLLLAAFLLLVFMRMNMAKREANKELANKNLELSRQKEQLSAQKDQIEAQRDKISKQKQDITDSIFYARRIQRAVLPPTIFFNEFLPENFIFFKPKDIVSGDFYWINQQNSKIVVAAVDCTGHGVPGAFMSMLGISYLNRIAAEMEFTNAARILDRLRELLIETLHQTGQKLEAKDGMDISLVLIDYKQKQIHYAGAYNSLYLISQNSPYESSDRQLVFNNLNLYEWKADKMPIGIHLKEVHPFTNHVISYQPNDVLYLFSDGFSDQFGGKHGRKYLPIHFKELLLKIASKKLQEQALEIQYELDNWQGDYEQVDDILIIGIKLL